MPDTPHQVFIFSFRRFSENRETNPALAAAHLTILRQVVELRLASSNLERDLLDFLSKPHLDPALVKACKEVLEHISTA